MTFSCSDTDRRCNVSLICDMQAIVALISLSTNFDLTIQFVHMAVGDNSLLKAVNKICDVLC